MDSRIAHLAIIVYDLEASGCVNKVLHDFAPYILGRMGIPVRERGVSVISVVLNAPPDALNSLGGKLGAIKNVSVKTLYSKI